VKITVVATGFDAEPLQQTQSFQTPAQRYLSKPVQSGSAARAADARPMKEDKPFEQPGVKSTSLNLNEEELEVPAFMRKPIGGNTQKPQ